MQSITEEQFFEILRRKMYYLEGLADGLHDEARKSLRRHVEDVRRLIKMREAEPIDAEPLKDSLHPEGI